MNTEIADKIISFVVQTFYAHGSMGNVCGRT